MALLYRNEHIKWCVSVENNQVTFKRSIRKVNSTFEHCLLLFMVQNKPNFLVLQYKFLLRFRQTKMNE